MGWRWFHNLSQTTPIEKKHYFKKHLMEILMMKKKRLKKFIGQLKKIRIERPFPENQFIHGFIHDMNKKLVLMHRFYDFNCYGYIIIRFSDISGIRSGKYERFLQKVLKKEGLLKQVRYDHSVPIKNFGETLDYFMKTEEIIIVECELDDELKGKRMIGRVHKVDEGGILWLEEIDASGEWNDDLTGLLIANITNIQFGTPTINTFSKYIDHDYSK